MAYFDEAQLEIASDDDVPERDDYGQAVLVGYLRGALFRINPYVPTEAIEAVRKVEGPCC